MASLCRKIRGRCASSFRRTRREPGGFVWWKPSRSSSCRKRAERCRRGTACRTLLFGRVARMKGVGQVAPLHQRRKVISEVPSVWVLQHTPCETLGTIEGVLRSHQIGFDYIQTYAGQPVPGEMADKAGLIVMGGPMGVYEAGQVPIPARRNAPDRIRPRAGKTGAGSLPGEPVACRRAGRGSEERREERTGLARSDACQTPPPRIHSLPASHVSSGPFTGTVMFSRCRRKPWAWLHPGKLRARHSGTGRTLTESCFIWKLRGSKFCKCFRTLRTSSARRAGGGRNYGTNSPAFAGPAGNCRRGIWPLGIDALKRARSQKQKKRRSRRSPGL